MCRFFWNFHASISHNALFEEKDGFSNKGVCQASKMYHPFGTLRRGQSENTLRVADAPKTDATVAGLWLVLLAADWPVRSSHTLSCQMCWHSSHRRRSDVADKRSCWTPYLCSSNLLQDGLSLCTWTASHCHHVLSVSIFFHLHLLYSSYYLYIYTRGHKSSAIANTPSPKTLLSLRGGQLRLSSLMRVDGAVWAVELTTFTGLNENDPSSLAGLSPHWPNFIMANYHSRPLLFWCCWGPAPTYAATWTH